MIVFAHTKFGLVRIQENGVKRGRNPPQSQRVLQTPVQIGLNAFKKSPICLKKSQKKMF